MFVRPSVRFNSQYTMPRLSGVARAWKIIPGAFRSNTRSGGALPSDFCNQMDELSVKRQVLKTTNLPSAVHEGVAAWPNDVRRVSVRVASS